MEQLIGGHIKIGGNFVIPAPYFEKILEASLQNAGIRYIIVEDITSSYQNVFHSSAVLFVEIAEDFYLDFLTTQKDILLYVLISENLNSLWLMFTDIINKNEDSIEKLSYSKFDILYSARDNNRLHFSFSFSLTAVEEKNAWIKMIELITKYESNDETILTLVRSIHAQKDNVRFFIYNSIELKWEILNPLLDETLRLSKEYYDYKKDKRIKKPRIILTEKNYRRCLRWDSEQWILHIQNLQIIMSQPNDISLYVNLFEINLTKAKKIYNEEYDSRKKFVYNQLLSEDETKQFYDYFEYIISAIVFSYTALEAFVNICIIDGYEYIRNDKNGNPEKITKEKILGKGGFSLREKLKFMLKEILKTPDPTKENWWQQFIKLEEIRDEIIHTRESKSEERYSSFLSKNIFKQIEVSKEIIRFYGYYIDKNVRNLLADYPYDFGYDNVRPYFISDEDYDKHMRNLHGIPENPLWEKNSGN